MSALAAVVQHLLLLPNRMRSSHVWSSIGLCVVFNTIWLCRCWCWGRGLSKVICVSTNDSIVSRCPMNISQSRRRRHTWQQIANLPYVHDRCNSFFEWFKRQMAFTYQSDLRTIRYAIHYTEKVADWFMETWCKAIELNVCPRQSTISIFHHFKCDWIIN